VLPSGAVLPVGAQRQTALRPARLLHPLPHRTFRPGSRDWFRVRHRKGGGPVLYGQTGLEMPESLAGRLAVIVVRGKWPGWELLTNIRPD
jgi:hypothetical protein